MPEQSTRTNEYLSYVKLAGQEYACGSISDKTQELLDQLFKSIRGLGSMKYELILSGKFKNNAAGNFDCVVFLPFFLFCFFPLPDSIRPCILLLYRIPIQKNIFIPYETIFCFHLLHKRIQGQAAVLNRFGK